MTFIRKNFKGLLLCFIIALAAFFIGKQFPLIGGPVFAILIGMIITQFIRNKAELQSGISFTSKKILQYAVVLLGFGLNLSVILQTGKQSLPIILTTIATSLIISYVIYRLANVPSKISVLIGVGSSICGGSAVAATAPVIGADDEEVAQAISVIFLFNVLAAFIFPQLGVLLGFSGSEGFGIFAGTAVNDTSSVTAAASTWDSMFGLGSATLDKAVTVKLTRTLAIIPVTLALAFMQAKKIKNEATEGQNVSANAPKVGIKSVFPMFILYFVLASVITTVSVTFFSVPADFFTPIKELSKFFIIMAMAAIGLNTNIVKLVKSGGKPIFMGLCCWIGITAVSLGMQHIMHLW